MTDPGTAAARPLPAGEPTIPSALVVSDEEPAVAVATGITDITPSRTGSPDVWLAGYGFSHPTARGTARPLHARCLVLSDRGFPNVLVTLDVLGLPQSMNEAIGLGVEALGVARADLLVTATHTHSGPVLVDRLDPGIAYLLDEDEIAHVAEYSDWLVTTVVTLVRDTLAAPRTPVTLSYGVGTANEAHNREGLPYTDPAVPTLVARAAGDAGEVVALVFGYACHPVARGFDGLYDADFPGIAQDLLERAFPGAVTFFLTGAAGDQNPSGGPQGPLLVNKVGMGVYNGVVSAIHGQMTAVTGPLRTDYRTIDIPLDLDAASLVRMGVEYAARASADPGGGTPAGRHARRMVAALAAGDLLGAVNLPLQLWTFTGSPPLRIVAIGGEVVSGYSVFLKSRFGGNSETWVVGYANENPCYVVSDEILDRGGYAAGWDTDRGIASPSGSMLYYGWPCRLRGAPDGVEQRVLDTVSGMIDAV
jgi:hypothetical protein